MKLKEFGPGDASLAPPSLDPPMDDNKKQNIETYFEVLTY